SGFPRIDLKTPDGHFKIPHLWPPENAPPGKTPFEVEVVEDGDRTYILPFVESINGGKEG
ncbi:MAG: hypothetical protein JRH00_17120, partial [Deltaproteobacteria bacterium]|nr:hypothetical protein [Deltaproteobacteria bacterium]